MSHLISGESDNGYILIDFPTYNYNTTEQILNSHVSINLTDQTQIIYGSGMCLSGNVGGGASTQLNCYESLTAEELPGLLHSLLESSTDKIINIQADALVRFRTVSSGCNDFVSLYLIL